MKNFSKTKRLLLSLATILFLIPTLVGSIGLYVTKSTERHIYNEEDIAIQDNQEI